MKLMLLQTDYEPMGQKYLATIDRACQIIELIQKQRGANLTEIAEEMEIAPSTVHGYLSTLKKHSYLRENNGIYHLGLQFLNKGGSIRAEKEEYEIASEKVDKMAAKTGERVQFIVEESGSGYCIYTTGGEESVNAGTRIGRQMPLHATASGKAILSELPESRVRSIIAEHDLSEFTDQTIISEDELFEELAVTRDRGYAINRGETYEGIHALAAPVQGPKGGVLGAFSILGPRKRLEQDRLDELSELLLSEINQMELTINYPD